MPGDQGQASDGSDGGGAKVRRLAGEPDIGDAAWAHNRWPTIGLYTGAGIGVLLGVVFYSGWVWTVLFIIGLATAGCLLGFAAAILVYGLATGP